METVFVMLAAVTVMSLAGVGILAYVLWRDRRRADDAVAESLAEFAKQPDVSPLGGGGPKPVK